MNIDWGSVGSGVLSGAGAGATIGNLFGPVGAGIGAGAGALIGGISGYFDSSHATEQQIDAEDRASAEWTRQQDALNAEYDRRVSDERAYNDPAAQAARLKAAGINPLSSMTSGGAVASNTAGNTGSSSAQVPFKSAMSDIIAVQQLRNSTALTESQIALNMANANKVDKETGKLTLEIALAEWDVKLKEQLYNYNEENNAILIRAGQQKINNLVAEYNKLKSETDVNKEKVNEIKQNILKSEAEVALLRIQKDLEQSKVNINRKQYDLLVQQFETGEFVKKFEEWRAKNEEVLFKVNTIKHTQIAEEFKFWHFPVDGGESRYITLSKDEFDMAMAQAEQQESIADLYSEGWFADLLLYLVTNIFSASATIGSKTSRNTNHNTVSVSN